MNTIEEEVPLGRRRRYSVEFKAHVVAACQGPGVSLAAIAFLHKLNANLLRRWV
ncbi:transposase [Paraburkholderia acidicola]|uniref:transposase n=1 Tax=Paraburkholderia acidicola TaxID=1912599 RepID=UPI000BBB7E19|nr:transposase [Paraburkholderia acidicola]